MYAFLPSNTCSNALLFLNSMGRYIDIRWIKQCIALDIFVHGIKIFASSNGKLLGWFANISAVALQKQQITSHGGHLRPRLALRKLGGHPRVIVRGLNQSQTQNQKQSGTRHIQTDWLTEEYSAKILSMLGWFLMTYRSSNVVVVQTQLYTHMQLVHILHLGRHQITQENLSQVHF